MKWFFLAFLLLVGFVLSLFFRTQPIPVSLVEKYAARHLPTNLVLRVDSIAYGFRDGLVVRKLRLYDTARSNPLEPMVSARRISINPLSRRLEADALRYSRLPDSYYAPGNQEKNVRVDAEFPALGAYTLTLNEPDILSVTPARVVCDILVKPHRIDFARIHLDWKDLDEVRFLDGFCYVDVDRQEVYGEVKGTARQSHIRPLIVALDVPVALPYMDGFTDVPGSVPSFCAWKVNLVNNDFDLWLDLHPTLGKYNRVSMKKADGKIHLHNQIRGRYLNYHQTIGPIVGVGPNDENLEGTILVTGTNGYNIVQVDAKSELPIAHLLRIGGFTGEYVGENVVGQTIGNLEFRFPRAMTNNYEVLNGKGHVSLRNGQIMRLKGFRGLIDAMPSIAPAVSWFSDTTQASCDYRIENGIIKTDNIYIEGSLFSIKMYGQFDSVRNQLDFVARVQFSKSDSMLSKVLHPLTWPFTKLLLEFRMTGPSENPKWEYISVVDRVMGVVE